MILNWTFCRMSNWKKTMFKKFCCWKLSSWHFLIKWTDEWIIWQELLRALFLAFCCYWCYHSWHQPCLRQDTPLRLNCFNYSFLHLHLQGLWAHGLRFLASCGSYRKCEPDLLCFLWTDPNRLFASGLPLLLRVATTRTSLGQTMRSAWASSSWKVGHGDAYFRHQFVQQDLCLEALRRCSHLDFSWPPS